MTAKQNFLYWREWQAVRKLHPDWADPQRHELHVKALGADLSHADFSNAEFDLVLAEFRALTRPADLNAQLRQIQMPKERLMHRIINLAPPAYASRIAADKFQQPDLDLLTLPQLKHLQVTLIQRARSKARKTAAEALF